MHEVSLILMGLVKEFTAILTIFRLGEWLLSKLGFDGFLAILGLDEGFLVILAGLRVELLLMTLAVGDELPDIPGLEEEIIGVLGLDLVFLGISELHLEIVEFIGLDEGWIAMLGLGEGFLY